jgi:putative ABC transport system permease protein
MFNKMMNGEEIQNGGSESYTYDDFLNLKFKLLLNTDYYVKENGIWQDKSSNEEYIKSKLEDALDIKLVGIIKPNEESNITVASYGEIGYLHELTEYVIKEINKSEIVKEQTENPDINVFTGNKFQSNSNAATVNTLTDEQKMQLSQMTEEQQLAYMSAYSKNSESTYEDNLELLGVVDLDSPSGINIYPSSFYAKDEIKNAIDDYNKNQTENGNEENTIEYTDLVGTMMTSITRIVNIISYVLIAFVAISLIVSSIMIAIITYISVLERTKEIGILRAMGTSKNDISKIFNAETFIEGLMSGILGIGITLLIDIPINLIVYNALGVSTIASLPISGAIVLIIISIVLNVIAGLIPAKIASKKDPAVVLRSE